MEFSRTIVIGCAGAGRRLGMGMPKALVEIEGKPILIRHLEHLSGETDIRVVVGYQAEKVIECVKRYREDIKIVYNHDYLTTGTGKSVSLAAAGANEYILNLDGDLLVHPEDMKLILGFKEEFVSGGMVSSEEPWFVQTEQRAGVEYAVKFTKESGIHEWNGITQMRQSRMQSGTGHVFQMVEPCLPVKYLDVRTREVDTIKDYKNAVTWVRNGFQAG